MSFDEFGFVVSPWTNLARNYSCLMHGKIKSILYDFQVQNFIFPNCLTMHSLEFCTKRFGCFSFVSVCVFYKSKTCAIYYLSSFLNKVIYLGHQYVILVFPRLRGLFQVYNDVSDHVLGLLEIILNFSTSHSESFFPCSFISRIG